MAISDEFVRLQALHENGTLTDAEFAEAKAKVLAEEHSHATVQTGAVERDISRLQIQNQILQLDQKWAVEREDYLLRGRYGARVVPTVSGSSNSAIFTSIIFLIAIIFGICMPRGEWLAIIGLLGIVVSIISGFRGAAKADIYDAAYEQYQQRRREITDQLQAHGR